MRSVKIGRQGQGRSLRPAVGCNVRGSMPRQPPLFSLSLASNRQIESKSTHKISNAVPISQVKLSDTFQFHLLCSIFLTNDNFIFHPLFGPVRCPRQPQCLQRAFKSCTLPALPQRRKLRAGWQLNRTPSWLLDFANPIGCHQPPRSKKKWFCCKYQRSNNLQVRSRCLSHLIYWIM